MPPKPTRIPACELFDLPSETGRDDLAHEAGLALLSQPFDKAVSGILKQVGTAAQADRAWLFRYNEEATEFHNTHEWCRPGIPSFVGELQHTPVSMIGWLHARLLKKRAVLVHDIQQLPKSARALRAEFQRQQNKSVLSVPLFHQGCIRGCIGFDAVQTPRAWTPDVIRTLQRCGDLIIAAALPPESAPPAPSPEPTSLYLPDHRGLRRVELDAIVGVRAERDYTRVHLRDGQSYLELRPLGEWVSLLPIDRFQRIHRSALVRVPSVQGVERTAGGHWLARMEGVAEKWSVSKRYRPALRSRLGV